MIHEGKWSEFIREIPIKKGDFLQIDPGTVHAINILRQWAAICALQS